MALLKEEIPHGAVPYFANMTANFAPFKHMNPIMRYMTAKYFDWKIFRPLLQSSPRDYLAEIKGAEGICRRILKAYTGTGTQLEKLDKEIEKCNREANRKPLPSR